MRPVYIEGQDIASVQPLGSAGTRAVAVELNMTNQQIKRAVVDMLGGFSDAEVFDFLRQEFADCFAEEVKA